MSNVMKPENQQQVLDAVQWALSTKSPLQVRGQGTKQDLGRPVNAEQVLDLSNLSGIADYQPSELYLTAAGGTPIAEIHAALQEQNQQLVFEPPDLGPLLGKQAGGGTIGGVVACNLAGPRRINAGSARDNFIGFHAVSGRGEEFKSGGKVVKNVTGFDLSKLITGSYGTLAVVTEATFKVLPIPDKTRTVILRWAEGDANDQSAIQAMTEALVSTNDVSAAAHLPAVIAKRSTVDYVSQAAGAVTAVRVEGPAPSAEFRCQAIKKLFSRYGDVEELHTVNSRKLWKEVADASYFVAAQDRALWRLSVPPSEGVRVVANIQDGLAGEVFYDWAGGLIWLMVEASDNASESRVRRCVGDVGGHATLIRASADIRSSVGVFQPLDDGMYRLSKRVKEGFDPEAILNPGHMYEGI